MTFSLKEIADCIDGDVIGDGSIQITGLAKIQEAKPGDLTFLANKKYTKFVATTNASAIIIGREFHGVCKRAHIICENPYYSFLRAVELFVPRKECFDTGIHPSAVVDESARLGDNILIGALAIISKNVSIGANVQIHPGTVIYPEVIIGDDVVIYGNVTIRERVEIGNRVIIHCGVVIGSDGFGFVEKEGKYIKLPQTGKVIIGDDVEIGANTTIDRATLGATVISRGTKLDNLIQIAHNVEIGEDTVIAAQAGISGSTIVGKQAKIGGQAGFVGHIKIGDQSIVGAKAGVSKDVPPGVFVTGYPAREITTYHRSTASLYKLPELMKKIKNMENELAQLRSKK